MLLRLPTCLGPAVDSTALPSCPFYPPEPAYRCLWVAALPYLRPLLLRAPWILPGLRLPIHLALPYPYPLCYNLLRL